jgi:hypothetical protein
MELIQVSNQEINTKNVIYRPLPPTHMNTAWFFKKKEIHLATFDDMDELSGHYIK